tara:strand:+ start:199 stop:393 length:195 start_codon:yes stop_codon:yes gene_type:complete
MSIEIQKIIFYDKSGNLDSKKIILPKIINTDISFQLQFGMNCPKDPAKSASSIKEYPDPNTTKQ